MSDEIIKEINNIDIYTECDRGHADTLVTINVDNKDLDLLKEFLDSLVSRRDSRLFNQSMSNIMRKL